MQSVSDVLTANGMDLTGWTLYQATDISDDGLTIAGWGTNTSGNVEAWVANLGGEPITCNHSTTRNRSGRTYRCSKGADKKRGQLIEAR